MWAPRSIEPLSGLNESFCGLWRFLYQPKSREPSQTSIHDYLQVGQKSSPIKHPLFWRGGVIGLAVVNLASGFTWVQLVFIFPESFVFLVFKR